MHASSSPHLASGRLIVEAAAPHVAVERLLLDVHQHAVLQHGAHGLARFRGLTRAGRTFGKFAFNEQARLRFLIDRFYGWSAG